MDLSTIVGVVLGVLALGVSILIAQGSSFNAFGDPPAMIVVFGGTCAAVLICFPFRMIRGMFGVLRRVFIHRPAHFADLVQEIVSLAETARREGLLSLENKTNELSHPFLVRAVQMVVDGNRPEVIENVMRTEMEALAARQKNNRSIFEQIGRFAPAFGMIGTLVGFIVMLGNLGTPESFAPGMAMALITTLYGAIIANLFCLPFVEKLHLLDRQERFGMEIMLRGVLAIQSGDNPRVIEQRLGSFLPDHERKPWEYVSTPNKTPKETPGKSAKALPGNLRRDPPAKSPPPFFPVPPKPRVTNTV